MTGMYVCSPAYTMVDKSKGSFTNRAQCAKEHLVNNVGTTFKASALLAGTGGAIALAPKMATKVAAKTGSLLAKLPFLKNVIKNPTRAGKIGILTAVGLGLYNILAKGIYKAGQIDQKYTDAAAIESQTKNIVLEK